MLDSDFQVVKYEKENLSNTGKRAMNYQEDIFLSIKKILSLALLHLIFLNSNGYSMGEEGDPLIFHQVYPRFYQCLDETEQQKLKPPHSILSAEEFFNSFQDIDDEVLLENLYRKSLLSEFPHQPNIYAPIRLALLRNPHFQVIEAQAKRSAKVDFCLGEQDQEEGSWLTTCIYHSLFWQGYQDNRVVNWLIGKRFYLAQLYRDLEDPYTPMVELANKEIRNAATILGEVTATIRELLQIFLRPNSIEEMKRELMSFTLEGAHPNPNQHGNRQALLTYLLEELSQRQKVNGISSVAGRIGELNFQTKEEKKYFLLEAVKDNIYAFYNQRLTVLYNELCHSGNRLFTLVWQKNISFLGGLILESEAQLYYQAQKEYEREIGRIYQGNPQFSFALPFTDVSSQNDSPFNWNASYGRFRSANRGFTENAERSWKSVAEGLGDSLIAYELAKGWANSQEDYAQERTEYWFKKYQEFAPTLPLGDFSSLKPLERSRDEYNN